MDKRRELLLYLSFVIVFVTVVVLSMLWGQYPVPLRTWVDLAIRSGQGGTPDMVLLQIRLPRILLASLIGGGLAVAGAAYQGLFNNPMVSPEILGAASGSGFGAALGLLLGYSIFGVQGCAFFFGLLAVSLVWILAFRWSRSGDPVLVLVLVGILISSIFGSLITLIKYVADPYSKLPAITFWLMGSLAATTSNDALFASIPILVGIIFLILLRWKLNVLSFGEEEARALGMDTVRLRLLIILASTLITASAVSVAGMIGWVGLVVPHLARMLAGPNHQRLLPVSLLLGACYMLIVDDIARNIYTTEIPLGILTSLIGAPFFLYLLLRTQRSRV